MGGNYTNDVDVKSVTEILSNGVEVEFAMLQHSEFNIHHGRLRNKS